MGCLAELPHDILHHICSFLTLTSEDPIRLSLSSKGLLRAVRTRPTLSFSGKGRRRREEVNYMLSTLNRYHEENINLETFTFTYFDPDFRSEYMECVRLAATKKGLRNLKVWWWSWDLPASVFQIESLVELRLGYCNLQKKGVYDLQNLKRLQLSHVRLADEGMFENIIRGSPLIEFLEIHYCCLELPHFNFKIFNLRKLKQLIAKLLRSCHTIEVINRLPNLESLSLSYPPNCAVAKSLSCSEYQNLTSLYLEGDMPIDDKFFGKLSQLEDLSISSNNRLFEINILKPSLKKIQLINIDKLHEARFDVPSIALFVYENYGNRLPKLGFTGNSDGGWISRITFESNLRIDTLWLVRLNKFLTALDGSETFLSFNINIKRFNKWDADRMMKDSASRIPEIREFHVSFHCAHAILEGIFCICRPRTIIFDSFLPYLPEFPKQLYDMVMKWGSGEHTLWVVTSVDIFQHSYWDVRKRGPPLQLPKTSDSREFLNIWRAHEWNGKTLTFGFNLEWRTLVNST